MKQKTHPVTGFEKSCYAFLAVTVVIGLGLLLDQILDGGAKWLLIFILLLAGISFIAYLLGLEAGIMVNQKERVLLHPLVILESAMGPTHSKTFPSEVVDVTARTVNPRTSMRITNVVPPSLPYKRP
ncbi:MAG: hypothetical protein R3B53_00115 [Candidatus Paceibacterota bacterium]